MAIKDVMGDVLEKDAETNRWAKAEALKLFRTFWTHARQYDGDIFAVATEFVSPGLWRRSLRGVFSPAELKAAEVVVDSPNLRETLFRVTQRGKATAKARQLIDEVVAAAIGKFEATASKQEPFRVRFEELVRTLKLSELESRILFARSMGILDEMYWATPHTRRSEQRQEALRDISCALGVPVSVLKGALGEDGKLIRYRVLDGEYDIAPRIREYLSGFLNEPFSSSYFEKDVSTPLPMADFSPKLREHAARICRLVRSAKGNDTVNVLLYGEPGTGKTSLARSLAKELGRTCYFIAQADTGRNGIYCRTPVEFRYGALTLCADQVEAETSLLVVDEADALLNRFGDKGLLNSVLDSVKVPVIWIANSESDHLDLSNRRRFDYSIRFDRLSERDRFIVWKNCVAEKKAGKLFPDSRLHDFAERYEVSAGGISRVLGNVLRQKPRTTAKAAKLVAEYMGPHCTLLGVGVEDEKAKPARDYSLEGLNIRGAVKLSDVISAVRRFRQTTAKDCPDHPRMNILLSGAPGTGKTEFVKYLASTLKQKLVVKMGSDLLGPYVGQTEANIRNAFRNAEDGRSVLFFDEVDGIVNSRATATASWESTKVNEVLHQMENFDGVFIAATNHMANLDEAVMRRFTFRLSFDWLEQEGKAHFWEVFFKTPLTDEERAELDSIPQLTPADFRNVRQRYWYLDRVIENSERLDALREEVSVKPRDVSGRRMGF